MIKALKSTRYLQYLASICATLGIASDATHRTWSSPSLIALQSDNSPIGVTLTGEEASWVASILMLGGTGGSIVAAMLSNRLGRKTCILLTGIPLFVAWFAVVFGRSAWILIVARFIAGMGGGLLTCISPIYVGEVAQKDIRGKLGTTYNILKLTGSLYVLSVGPFISYTALGLSSSVVALIFMGSFIFMPESPYYLIMKRKRDEAIRNLAKLDGKTPNDKTIETELAEIESTVEYDMKNKSSLWEFISKKEYRKSMIIMFGIKTLQQLSGMSAIEAYTQTIVSLSNSSMSAEISSIICGVVQIPAALLAALLVDKMGRKPLMIISCLGCGAALVSEGVYFFLKDYIKADVDSISWLPTTALVVFLLMNPIGLFTLPYVLLGELFATNIKSIAVSFFTFYGSILAFLVTKFFQPIYEAWGMYTVFWLFGGCCLLGTVFVILVLPETKGKTFAEIQKKLNENRNP